MPPTFRRAVPEDYRAFAELFPELGVDDPIPDSEAWEREQMPCTYVLEEDGRVVAYSCLRPSPPDAYVTQVVTSPSVRGRGYGRHDARLTLQFKLMPDLIGWMAMANAGAMLKLEMFYMEGAIG